jgi:probable biosynthetic protein (TIGR04099 family)
MDGTSAEGAQQCGEARHAHGPLARVWSVALGMPHLAIAGLSESWLLKEAGHVHWQLLEEAVGVPSRHWKDSNGCRLYASFIAYEVEGHLLHALQEGSLLLCHSELRGTGHNRACSRHILTCAELPFEACLWMVSSFVRRDGDSNRAFVRSAFGSLTSRHGDLARKVDDLMHRRRQMRLDATRLRGAAATASRFRVCPMEDFNHAGMVYFASFPRYLDRAELATRPVCLAPLTSRRCFYYGNADPGDEIAAFATPQGRGSVSQAWSREVLLCASETTRKAI